MKLLGIQVLAIASILIAPSLAPASSLIYPNFSSTAGMTLLSSATAVNNQLQLTSNSQVQWGQAWFNELQNVAVGFKANFSYQLTGGSTQVGLGDGFAFVIQNDPHGSSAVGSTAGGGTIGYGYSIWNGISHGLVNGLAIEMNAFTGRLYIQSCGSGPLYSHQSNINCTLNSTPTGLFNDGNVHTVLVNYDGALLTVGIDGSTLLSTSTNLGSLLDLSGGTSAYVGFTAGSGGAAEFADIRSFDFETAPEPSTFLLLGSALAAGLAFRGRSRATRSGSLRAD